MSDDHDAVLGDVLEIMREMQRDLGFEPVDAGAATRLAADVGFSSVDVVHLLVTLERMRGGQFDFERLIAPDEGRDDLSVGEVVEFVAAQEAGAPSAGVR